MAKVCEDGLLAVGNIAVNNTYSHTFAIQSDRYVYTYISLLTTLYYLHSYLTSMLNTSIYSLTHTQSLSVCISTYPYTYITISMYIYMYIHK